MKNNEIQQLVELAKNGDADAYKALVSRYKRSIFSIMFKMIQNTGDAEDLTMEAFTKALMKINLYEDNFAFSTWLFKIAINNCIDHIRRQKKKIVSLDDETTIYEPVDTSPTQLEIMETDELEDAMMDATSFLFPQFQVITDLRFYHNLKYEEIASEMEINIGTVKSYLSKIKEMMRKIIEKQNINI